MAQLDAYLPWARATGFRGIGGAPSASRWMRLLMQTTNSAAAFARAQAGLAERWIRLASAYAEPPSYWSGTRHCTALVSGPFLEALAAGGLPEAHAEAADVNAAITDIVRFEIGFVEDLLPLAAPPTTGTAPPPKSTGPQPRVVVGVIDDGIAFANQRFRGPAPGDSRFLSFWDQNPAPPDATVPDWSYGRRHARADIEAAMAAHGAGGVVDEDACYRRLAYGEVRRRATHGTHVADVACGCDPAALEANTPPIVGVQLPADAIVATSCASVAVFLLDALRYIAAEADATGGRPAVVVNVSLGDLAGPHDGSSLIEKAIDELIEHRQATADLRVVFAAGNSYLAQGHARIELAPGGRAELGWRVQPCDGTPNFVEIWFDEPDVQGVRIGLAAPDGTPIGPVAAGAPPLLHPTPGAASAMLHFCGRPANGASPMALLAIAPTDPGEDQVRLCRAGGIERWDALAPCGLWTLRIDNGGSKALACHAYVQRDDESPGRHAPGRQSRFEEPRYRRYDDAGRVVQLDPTPVDGVPAPLIRRAGTLNGLATGREVDIALAVERRPEGLRYARYAGTDSADSRRRARGLTIGAVSEDSPALFGVLASGTRSGSHVAMNGSSVAAPQLTRAIAKGYAAGHFGMVDVPSGAAGGHGEGLDTPVLAEDPAQRASAGRRRG